MYVTIPADQPSNMTYSNWMGNQPKIAEVLVRAGACLYYEGDRFERLYQVKSGVLRLTRVFEDGRRQVIAFGYPGDIVGFPCDDRHHTDCEALTEARLQPYSRCVLESGEDDPQLHEELLKAALREIGAMQDHFMMLGRKSALEKVASFLCALTERVGEDLGQYKQLFLPMNRSDIADFLGLTTETVSRIFSQLRERNIITIDNIRTVVVLQPRLLSDLSNGQVD